MMPRRLAAAVAAGALIAMATQGPAQAGPWSLAPGETYSELTGEFFSAGTFYDANRDRTALPGGGLYERRVVRSTSEFGWKKHASVQLSMPAISLTRRDATGALSDTRTGFGDIGLGLRYTMLNGAYATAWQFRYSTPMGYNRRLDPALGDGRQALEVGFELGTALADRGFLQLGLGNEYRFLTLGMPNKDFVTPHATWEHHVTADAALGLWVGGSLQVAGLYRGEFPVLRGYAYPEVMTQLAGSRVTYRVDDRLDAFAGSWHSPGGKNSLHVDQFYAGFAWKNTRLGRNQGFLGSARRP